MNSTNLPTGGSQGNLDLWGNEKMLSSSDHVDAATAVVYSFLLLFTAKPTTVPPALFSSMHSDWSGRKLNG